jgi:hypothetical protein
MEVKIIDMHNIKGQNTGWVNVKTKTYHAPKTPEHFMRMFGGFGISEDILNKLVNLGVEDVCIIYHGVRHTYHYTCKLSQYLKSEQTWINKEDKIPDPQRFVSIKDMREEIIK